MKLQADIAFLLAQGFCVVVALVIIITFWYQFSHNSAWVGAVATSPVAVTAVGQASSGIYELGNFFAAVWIVSAIASVIAVFFIETSPVFAVLGIIAMPIELFLSLIFHDFFFIMAANSFLAPAIAAMPLLSSFFTALPAITLVFIFVSIIMAFAK